MKTSSWVKVVAASFICASALQAQAATYYWDDGSVTVDGASGGGTGTWTVGAAGWEDGSIAQNWANSNDAVFGGTAGTLTLGGAITAGSITFNTAGYLLDTGANALTATTLAGSGNFTKFGTGTLTLSGSSSYSGALTIRDGIVQLNSGASLSSGTGITIEGGAGTVGGTGYPFKGVMRGGTLYLRDDTGSPGSNQLGSQTVTLKNGTVFWYSGAGADTTTISNLTLDSGFNTIAVAPSSNPDVLKITNLNRTAGATVEFRAAYHLLGTGEAQIRPTNLNGSAIANTNGILGGWAFVSNANAAENAEPARYFAAWNASATIGSEVGSIVAATPDKANGTSGGTSNSQDIASAASTENWLINDSSTRNIIGGSGTTTVTINSLIEQADLKINNGSTLVVASGGVIFRNNNFWLQTSAGSTGYLTSGTNDLYLQTDGGAGDQYIKVIIKDGAAGAVTLRKSGSGLVKLNQFQTYTGGTFINQGTLQNNAATAYTVSTMGTGAITINGGGTLQANGVHQFGWNAGTWNNFTINDGGTFAIGANDNYIGSLTLNDNASITGTGAGYVGLSTGSLTYTGSAVSKQATIASKLALASPQGNVNATFTVNGSNPNGDLVVNGAITSGGSLTKAGTGILALSGVNTYTGNTTISAGTLLISGSGQLNSGAYAGTISNSGTLTYSSSATQTLSGKISGAGVLKVTSGTLTLSNTGNDYNGATTVNGGTLNVTGVTASGSAVALNGGTLKGTGTVGGTVTVATGGAITGGDGTTGTLTIGGNLTYNGNGTVNIGTLSNYTSAAAVSITGTLTPGSNTITLNLPTGSASAGTFHLLGTTYNSLTGIALGTAPTLSSRQSGGLAATSSYIDYVITGVNPYWTGAQSSEWSTATIPGSKNWALPGVGGTTDYLAGDIVLFDDNATTTTPDIATDVSPTSVTFSNTSKNYTLTGAAGIAGSTGLSKSGTGTLTISAANSYTGATSISGGVVNIQSAGALGGTGSGTTVSSGAALEIQGGITVGAEALSLNGSGVSSGGALRNISGSNTYGGAVTLAGASRINSDAGTLTLTGGIANGGFGLTVGGAGDTTVSTGVIAGNGSLTKDGNGTLTLSANNTYTGGTTVNGGTLAVSGTQSATGTITVNNGGTLTFAGNWNNAGNVNINNGGTLTITSGGLFRNSGGTDVYTTGSAITVYTGGTLNLKTWGYGQDGGYGGLSDYSVQRVMDGGTINITGNSNPTGLSSDFRVTANGGSFNMLTAGQTTTIENNVNDNIRVGGALTFGGAGNITINEVIQDNSTAGSIIKTGAGTLTLSVANTYTGSTTINEGIFTLTGQLQSTSSLTVNAGATANINATNWLVAGHGAVVADSRVITVNGGTIVFGAYDSRIGNVTLSNGGTFSSNRDITGYGLLLNNVTSGAATVTVSNTGGNTTAATMNGTGGLFLGAVQNFNVADVTGDANTDLTVSMKLGNGGTAGGTGGITKTGAGTMVLSGQNTYTGLTTVNAGTLELSGGAAIADTGAVSMTNVAGATLKLSASETIGSLAGGGTSGGNVDLQGNLLTVGDASTTTYAGTISGSDGQLAKQGSGKLILTGTSSYTGGTSVNAGTLALNGTLTSAITVNSGGRLQGSGSTTGGLIISGTLAPGNSIESLGAGGDIAFDATSTFAYELDSSATLGNTSGDLLYASGSLSIDSGAILTLSELAADTLTLGEKLTLISYNGTWNSGVFTYLGNSLNDGGIITLGSNSWQFKYNDAIKGSNYTTDAGGASFVTMTVIPEPGTAGIVATFLAAALLRKRRFG